MAGWQEARDLIRGVYGIGPNANWRMTYSSMILRYRSPPTSLQKVTPTHQLWYE